MPVNVMWCPQFCTDAYHMFLLQDTRQRHSAKQQGSPTLKKFSAALRKAILDGQDLSNSWTPAKMAAAVLHKQQTGLIGTSHGVGTTPSRASRDAPQVCSTKAAACWSRLHLERQLALMLAGRPVGWCLTTSNVSSSVCCSQPQAAVLSAARFGWMPASAYTCPAPWQRQAVPWTAMVILPSG